MFYPIVIESAGGEYMDTVVILEWHAKVGEPVKAGDLVVTVETAKAATEIEAPHDGILHETLFEVGQEAPVGVVLGRIRDAADQALVVPSQNVSPSSVAPPILPTSEQAPLIRTDRVIASPLARRIASERGVDLATVTGTGPRGRIKQRDVEAALSAPVAASAPAQVQAKSAMAAPSRSAPKVGDTAPIVLLHGFGADRSSWRLMAPLLKSSNSVILPELPSHGDAPEIVVRGIDDVALAISDTLDAMGIEEAHLVGHSLGGATALALTRIGKLRIRSLCLIAPGGLGPEINFAFLQGFTDATRTESLQPWLDKMVADPSVLPESFARAVLRQRDKTNVQAPQRRLLEALFPDRVQSMRLQSALEAVSVPTKVIWGLKDAIIPSSHAFTAPGNVGIHLLRDIGHVPQLECPALVARLIDELVSSQP